MIILSWIFLILLVISLVILLIQLENARLITKQEHLRNHPEPDVIPGLSWFEMWMILRRMEQFQRKYKKSKQVVWRA